MTKGNKNVLQEEDDEDTLKKIRQGGQKQMVMNDIASSMSSVFLEGA
jgi:hypothetical protein